MKKILFYTDTPILGGAENQMMLLAKFLPKDKFSVAVACACNQKLNPWCQQLIESGVEVIRMNVLHKHDPRHWLYLKKILPVFDLMHMHVWNPASGRYGFLAAAAVPLVITEHDPYVLKGFKGWLKNKLIARAERIIVASRATSELVQMQAPFMREKITVIPNGIDIRAFTAESQLANRNEFRRVCFGTLPNEKIVLCVAELHERKGQKYLIEAMREVIKEFPSAKLVLIGDGPERRLYEKLGGALGDRIFMPGRRKEIARIMAASDIFVLPSRREAFGLVLLEAAATGLPIIASRTGGIPEIIENGKTGLLVEPENSKLLSKSICALLREPSTGSQMAENMMRRLRENFDAEKMADETARVYDKLL